MLRGIDRKWRWLPMAIVALTTGLAAAPAQAHVIVRSDGAGLRVEDSHGHDNSVSVGVLDGKYAVRNNIRGSGFDRQLGCAPRPFDSNSVICDRNGPIIDIDLRDGSDFVSMEFAPVGNATIRTLGGDDEVIGHAGVDLIETSLGNDRLFGLAGDDTLRGGINSNLADSDRLDGGSGNDLLEVANGQDVLIGGPGRDILMGEIGSDFIDSKEDAPPAEADTVSCGSNFDSVEADALKDSVSADCEVLDQSPIGETPHVVLPSKVLDVSRAGVARARLRCPAKTTIGCRGKLSLRLAKRGTKRPAQTRYKIAAGKSRSVRVRLTAREARRVRGRVRGILKSVEKGRIGPKTTIRQPRLR